MKLYKYSGTIEELAVERGRISYIKLFDVTDFDKAPTRLEVFGALGKYIEAIEGTDAEERYIKSDWYFDSNLYLRRIEIPGGEVGRPAKIITQSPDNIDQLDKRWVCGDGYGAEYSSDQDCFRYGNGCGCRCRRNEMA